MSKPVQKEQAKHEYLKPGATLASVALKFGVSKRTVERWSSDGGWDALKQAEAKPTGEQFQRLKAAASIDDLAEVERAIAKLAFAIDTIEAKSLEGAANALAKLVELRRKMLPQTAAEIAELAIASNISPEDFISALKNLWRLKA